MLTGYTPLEAAAIPLFARPLLLDYFNQVYDQVKAYLADTPVEALQTKAGDYTRYQHIQMALLDNVRHLGEIFSLFWKMRQRVFFHLNIIGM